MLRGKETQDSVNSHFAKLFHALGVRMELAHTQIGLLIELCASMTDRTELLEARVAELEKHVDHDVSYHAKQAGGLGLT